jgi:hypothetical protein
MCVPHYVMCVKKWWRLSSNIVILLLFLYKLKSFHQKYDSATYEQFSNWIIITGTEDQHFQPLWCWQKDLNLGLTAFIPHAMTLRMLAQRMIVTDIRHTEQALLHSLQTISKSCAVFCHLQIFTFFLTPLQLWIIHAMLILSPLNVQIFLKKRIYSFVYVFTHYFKISIPFKFMNIS